MTGRIASRAGTRLAIMAAALMVLVAVPAIAHYEYFTGSQYQDWYIPSGDRKYIMDGSVADVHSYSFVSANDVANAAYVCGETVNHFDHNAYDGTCNWDFVRHCSPGQRHSPWGSLDCHDQDSNTNIHARAANGSAGTTVTIHGGY